ncbi:MAG: hypothetical protein QW165_05240 [Candidatus Woesearchaeota archaeon]
MKKILVTMLVLLAACQFGVPVKPRQQPEVHIFTGTTGLEASFNEASISNLLMCQQSDLYVDIKNTGATDIVDGMALFIFEDQYFQPLSGRSRKFSLEGKSQYNPKGGFDQVHFRMRNTGILPQFESYKTDVIFRACYKYATFASAQVCIDPDIANLNPRKICRSQPVVLPGGQGAPVAVTRVEPLMVPEGNQVRPVFAIYVQHMGRGAVVHPEGVEAACAGGPQQLNYAVARAYIQNRELMCEPAEVRIESGRESRIICQLDDLLFGEATGTFTTILSVQLDYGYVNNAILPMTITRLPGQKPC